MSPLTRLIAFSAMVCAAACHGVAAPPATIGLFYSFDGDARNSTAQREMQLEFARILSPTSITVEWRALAEAQGAEFPEIFVIRFHGACSADGMRGAGRTALDAERTSLARTRMMNDHVLPFSEVDCNLVQRYIAPVDRCGFEDGNLMLGRALARVVAHEFYHMLTQSPSHARSGIARAEYSREDLTATSFLFTESQTEWMRQWAAKRWLAAGDHRDENLPADSDTVDSPAWQSSSDTDLLRCR